MSDKMRLLDLFCGAGGAGMGYHRAGFEVVGVDIAPQKHYPFEFHQADAFDFLAEHGREFDIIHASPPCQQFSRLGSIWKARLGARAWAEKHPDLIAPMRHALLQCSKPYVIENVVGAPLQNAILLCGTMFGLKVYRHRLFESNLLLLAPPHAPHHDNCKAVGRGLSLKGFLSVTGHGGFGFANGFDYAKDAMGIEWMDRKDLSQAIPPAYTEFIGRQIMRLL